MRSSLRSESKTLITADRRHSEPRYRPRVHRNITSWARETTCSCARATLYRHGSSCVVGFRLISLRFQYIRSSDTKKTKIKAIVKRHDHGKMLYRIKCTFCEPVVQSSKVVSLCKDKPVALYASSRATTEADGKKVKSIWEMMTDRGRYFAGESVNTTCVAVKTWKNTLRTYSVVAKRAN